METYETWESVSTIDGFESFQATLFTESEHAGFVGELPFDTLEINELGVDPRNPTNAHPGSKDKVRMLAARYAVGLPLWHEHDCNDHGTADNDSTGMEESLSSVSKTNESEWDGENFNQEQ